jgi:hypothetical protein
MSIATRWGTTILTMEVLIFLAPFSVVLEV